MGKETEGGSEMEERLDVEIKKSEQLGSEMFCLSQVAICK